MTMFNLYSDKPRVGLSVNNKQKVRQAMVKISRRGVATTSPSSWPDNKQKVRQAMVNISRGGVATTSPSPWPDLSAEMA